jgi:hypothetical protein
MMNEGEKKVRKTRSDKGKPRVKKTKVQPKPIDDKTAKLADIKRTATAIGGIGAMLSSMKPKPVVASPVVAEAVKPAKKKLIRKPKVQAPAAAAAAAAPAAAAVKSPEKKIRKPKVQAPAAAAAAAAPAAAAAAPAAEAGRKDMLQAYKLSRKGIISDLAEDRLRQATVWAATVNISKKDPMTKFYKMLKDTNMNNKNIKYFIDLIPKDRDVELSVFGDAYFCVLFMMDNSNFKKAFVFYKEYRGVDYAVIAVERFVVILGQNYRLISVSSGRALAIFDMIVENNLLTPEKMELLVSYIDKGYHKDWFQEGIENYFFRSGSP